MSEVLLDTDVFIDHLRQGSGLKPEWRGAAYSIVTRAELYAGKRVDEDALGRLLGFFMEIPLGRLIAEEAGRIRRKTEVALADAVIAATAMVNDLELVTRNIKHFRGVRGLKIYRAAK